MDFNGQGQNADFLDIELKVQNIDPLTTVAGLTDFVGDIESDAFITTGGTSSQFVKGDGTLDSSTLVSNPSYVNFEIIGADLITNSIKNDDDVFTINLTTASIHNGTGNVLSVDSSIEAYTFNKTGGTGIEYLMADGSTLTQSATSGNSNFYLYNNTNSTTNITPVSGEVIINSLSNSTATIVYISHITRDNIDVEVFWKFVNTLTELYLQDQNLSTNYIQYNITAAPTITVGNKIAIPISVVSSGGTGATAFGAGHDILVSYFTNNLEVDTRLSTLETKTTNILYGAGLTEIGGTATVIQSKLFAGVDDGNFELLMNAGTISMDSDIINTNRDITCTSFITTNGTNQQLVSGDGSLNSNALPDLQNLNLTLTPYGLKNTWTTSTGGTFIGSGAFAYSPTLNRLVYTSNLGARYSNDYGKTWTDCIGSVLFGTNGIFWNHINNIFNVRTNTQQQTSVDGITWTTPITYTGGSRCGSISSNSITYAFGLWISNGGDTSIQTSVDGSTWTQILSFDSYGFVFTGTKVISFGGTSLHSSTNGVSWSSVAFTNTQKGVYSNKLKTIFAYPTGTTSMMKSIDDGVSWTTTTSVFTTIPTVSFIIWDDDTLQGYLFSENLVDKTLKIYIFNSNLIAVEGNLKNQGVTTGFASGPSHGLSFGEGRFIIARNSTVQPIYSNISTTNTAISGNNYMTGNQFITGNLSCSGVLNLSGVANIDIMLRDSPFIGIKYINNSGDTALISNSLWTPMGGTVSAGSTYALTNNFTRQLCSASWTTVALADGAGCGFASTITIGARVSRGFNFGLSAVLGISDSAYNANNCQNFFGLWNLSTQIPLNQATQLSVQRNMVCFGSDTDDTNICIYTAGASSTVKQVDLGVSFPANRPAGSLSTDWFKFTIYWDTTKFFYKAVNTTTNVVVSGTFTALVADIPATSINLFPQCVRIMGTPQTNGQAKLQVQRFGVYY